MLAPRTDGVGEPTGPPSQKKESPKRCGCFFSNLAGGMVAPNPGDAAAGLSLVQNPATLDVFSAIRVTGTVLSKPVGFFEPVHDPPSGVRRLTFNARLGHVRFNNPAKSGHRPDYSRHLSARAQEGVRDSVGPSALCGFDVDEPSSELSRAA